MFKSTTARETSIEEEEGKKKKKRKGVGGKTLHGERGDRCRRVTGTERRATYGGISERDAAWKGEEHAKRPTAQ